MKLNLKVVPEKNYEFAKEAFFSEEPEVFVTQSYTGAGLQLVADNSSELMKQGIYESALIFAYQMHTPLKSNFEDCADEIILPSLEASYCCIQYSREFIYNLFQKANRKKMLAAGEEIPEGNKLTLYRGVYDKNNTHEIRGISWTDSIITAQNYAYVIHSAGGEAAPAIFKIVIPRDLILCKVKGLHEHEYLVDIDHVDNIHQVNVL